MARLQGSIPLDVNGAARLMGWHPMTVYSKARKGEMPSYKVGCALCFDKDELLEFKEQYEKAQESKRTESQKKWDKQLADQRALQESRRRRVNHPTPEKGASVTQSQPEAPPQAKNLRKRS